jgi:pimeloyl-ACP methyl ester carboxylesterase
VAWVENEEAIVAIFILTHQYRNLPRCILHQRQMQVPTMLVAAEKDDGGGPPEDMRAIAAAILGARIEVIIGAGHIVNYEAGDVLAGCVADSLGGWGQH